MPENQIHQRQRDPQSVIWGLVCALVINGGLIGVVWVARSHAGQHRAETMTFVDAKLVRFGKPRDLSFLPHVQATPPPRQERKPIKLTEDPDQPAKPLPKPPEEEPDKPLPNVNDLPKNLREEPDDRATKEATEEGDPNGQRGGTAAEASGDPFIRAVTAAITERWAVPNMLTPGELSTLSAAACLKIDEDGKLVEFKIVEKSGNDLFDGSLNTTLGSITTLPKPFGPFAQRAYRGKLCPVFTKQ